MNSGQSNRVKYGVRLNGDAWVSAPEGDYTITTPPGLSEVSQRDLIISERPIGEPTLTDDDIRWLAIDAMCDARGANSPEKPLAEARG